MKENGYEPTIEEIAEEMNCSVEDIGEFYSYLKGKKILPL